MIGAADVKRQGSVRLVILPILAVAAVRLLGLTLRVRRDEGPVSELWRGGTPAIYVVWHSRILLLPYLYGRRRARVLASRSRDGELATRFLTSFGLEAVRGSSSRGGASALWLLRRSLRDGRDVVVVPDGPRGPREMIKPGVVTLARLSGAPIVPVAVGASAQWRLGSWDEFRIPRPFARCVVRFGDPIRIPRDGALTEEGEEAARKDVEAALRELSWRADEDARA